MKFAADHYFHIGSRHYSAGKPCQDYAISASNEDSASVIVSDGCSSGGNTDVGSRVLALATLQALRGFSSEKNLEAVTDTQKKVMQSVQTSLCLVKSDLLATCVYAFMDRHGGFVHILGDGVIAIRYRNGETRITRTDWMNNAPFYPIYDTVDAQLLLHNAYLGDPEGTPLKVSRSFQKAEESSLEEELVSFTEAQKGIVIRFSRNDLEEIEFVAVFSDGVTQIENVDWRDAVGNFLAFKNTEGEFAKRRMIRGIKDFQKLGKGPIDDISYAVIKIEQEIDQEEKV